MNPAGPAGTLSLVTETDQVTGMGPAGTPSTVTRRTP